MRMNESTYEYLKPTEAQVADMAVVRAAAKVFGDVLDNMLPDGRDKQFSIRAHRQVAMWANIAITRYSDGSPRA